MNKLSIILLLCTVFIGCKNKYDIDMVYISGGSFLMGSNDIDADSDESPVHSVRVKDFYLSKYEITQDQWRAVMGHNPSIHREPNYPVENVSWDDCQDFIYKLNNLTGLNYRLPTEAEWEYVASKLYKNTDKKAITTYAWCPDSFGRHINKISSQKVGLLKPDSFGIYDIIGNVNEWCADSYDSLSYTKGFSEESDEKVFKGGSFASQHRYLRPANRNHTNRQTKHYSLGLRLAMDAEKK